MAGDHQLDREFAEYPLRIVLTGTGHSDAGGRNAV
jgi:hypothetical protein